MTPQDTETFATHCAHIFPESLCFLEGRDPEENVDLIQRMSAFAAYIDTNLQRNFVVTAYTMLNRFGCTNIQQELTGANIHRLENVMTLEVNVHYHFDKLLVWLEAVEGRVRIHHAYVLIVSTKGTS